MIWPKPIIEKRILEAFDELTSAEEHWQSEKQSADRIMLKADYRVARARSVYSKLRELLAEFGEVPDAFPEIEPVEVTAVRPGSFVERAAPKSQWSVEKQAAIDAQRARLVAECQPPEVKRYLSFETGCFSLEQPLFSR